MTPERDWFAVSLEVLGLSTRGLRRARKAGATTVGELCLLTDEDLQATSGGIAEESRREIRLLYVAPAMIGHYVEQHGYAPPAELIAAVAASPLPDTPEYRAACAGFREQHKQRIAELVREQQRPAEPGAADVTMIVKPPS